MIFLPASVHAKNPETVSEPGVIGSNHPSISSATEILRREKAEAAKCSHTAHTFIFIASGDGLRCIFDHFKFVRIGDGCYRSHICRQAEKMYRDYRPCLRGDCGF